MLYVYIMRLRIISDYLALTSYNVDYGKSCTGSLLGMVADAREAFDQCENNPACTGIDTSPDCNIGLSAYLSYRLCGSPISMRDSECNGRVYYKPGIIDIYN